MGRADSTSLRVLKSAAGIALTLVLVAQAAAFYSIPKTEAPFEVRPLAQFPQTVGQWTVVEDLQVEDRVREVLKADDILDRFYRTQDQSLVSLFVAFFKSQTTGVSPHSPKNCLPGAGWAPLEAQIRTYAVPGLGTSIQANRYIVARGEQRTLVVYWYQTPHRAIASEYEAKFWLVADALRYRRSDTTLVRISLPLGETPAEKADEIAARFIEDLYPALKTHLPH